MQDALSLPIHVSQEELQEKPGFASLLQDLASHHISPDGVSKEKSEKLEEHKAILHKEKSKYIQMLLYYTTINDLLLDYKIDSSNYPQEEHQLFEMLGRVLNTAEAALILDYSPLRIDPQTLRESQIGDEEAVKKQTKILVVRLFPKIEAAFEEKCKLLADFYDPQSHKKELQLARGLQLSEVIANKKSQNSLLSQSVQNDALHNTKAFWEYYRVLESVVAKLYSVITTYKLRDISSQNNDGRVATDPYVLAAEWQKVKLETLELKASVVSHQIMEDTYGPRENCSPTEGLRIIASHLQDALESARQTHERTTAHRAQYESLGLGFPDLAKEYGGLLKNIANKEWALHQLDTQDSIQ